MQNFYILIRHTKLNSKDRNYQIGENDMTFNNAKRLHNEDEVTIKETGEVVTVLQAYPSENGKYIILECDDGNTYYDDEVR